MPDPVRLARFELEKVECLDAKGEEEDNEEASESEEFLQGLFQPHPDSPNIQSEMSSALEESRVLSVLQEPSSELLLISDELSLESSSKIFWSW